MYQMTGYCWLCGRNGANDPLDVHHIFGGALRSKSEQYGLTVLLCHKRCHIFGPDAAHSSAETQRALKKFGQRFAMDRYGWDIDDWRAEFGKNYLDDEEIAQLDTTEPETADIGFALTAEVLPW